jgi:flagellar hook-associated protein FlgK
MQSFEIGLSGLDAARKALDTIGNNIANAATEGYHRQRIDLAPSTPTFDGRLSWGGGVDVMGISRSIDTFVEKELISQNGTSGQTAQELTTLNTIQSTFGELSGNGSLSQAISQFFNACQDLAAHPSESTYQRQLITSAQSMASQFQTIGTSLTDMADRIRSLVDETVTRINELATAIGTLNDKIQKSEIGGSTSNNLRDQRDQQITELSKLIGIQTRQQDHGMVDVTCCGIPLVMGTEVTALETGSMGDGGVGVGEENASLFRTAEGGTLGGLLSVKNDLLPNIQSQFDTLATSIIRQFNNYHVQGIGSEGSFSDLTGWNVNSAAHLEDLGLGITDGNLNIRVTNTATGAVSRVTVAVDASTDTLQTIATKIDSATGLNASVLSDRLHIGADAGYEFDFLPASLPEPDTSTFATPANAPSVAVSGIYTGDANDTLTFKVQAASGSGSVGNGAWSITVTNQDGDPVTQLEVGSGYVAGTPLDLGNGLKVSLSTGSLTNGDTFTVKAFASTDTSGLLAAVGLNAFFSGTSAQNMGVLSEFDNNPGRLATSLGSDHADNVNAKRLAGLADQALDDLSGCTISDYYNRLVTTLGQDISTKKMRQDNTEAMLQDLQSRQSEASGVDVNDQAAQILMYQQMYQAMAKFMNSVQTTTETLMSLLS